MTVINKQCKILPAVLSLLIFSGAGSLYGVETDTIRAVIQACDSFYFAATDSIYRENTVIEYAHEATDTSGGVVTTFVDSLFLYDLSIGASYNYQDTVTKSICGNNTPYHYCGEQFYTGGNYEVTVKTALGCDSIRRLLRLHVHPIELDTLRIGGCAGEFPITYTIGDKKYKFSSPVTNIFNTGTDTNGCPIYTTFIVEKYPEYNKVIVESICDADTPYIAFGTSFTESTIYERHDTTRHGCDSSYKLILTVNPTYNLTDTIIHTICSADLPYQAGDSVFYETGIYDFPLHTVNGCDSIEIHLELTVIETRLDTITKALCRDDFPFVYGGRYYYHGGEYTIVDDSSTSTCPNTTLLILKELPLYDDTIHVVLCQSDMPYGFAGKDFSQSTVYTYKGLTVDGCDSLKTLDLTVHPSYANYDTVRRTICRNQLPYTFEDSIFTESGTFDIAHPTVHGCDSAFTHFCLTVIDTPTIRINGRTEFCQGKTTMLTASGADQYQWSSGETTATITTGIIGTYSVTGTSAEGCFGRAAVQVNTKRINATITGNRYFCRGKNTILTVMTEDSLCSFQWHDGSTADSIIATNMGQYTVTITDAIGCTNTLSAYVTEYELPEPVITGNFIICSGNSTVLLAQGGESYLWNDGSTQAYLSVNSTATYAVTATDHHGCSAYTSATVIVHDLPEITIIKDVDNICTGENVHMYAKCSTGTSYLWLTGGENTPLIDVSPTRTTTYSVLVTDANKCSNTASTTITVNSLPVPYIDGPTHICRGDTAHLTAQGGVKYHWHNGLSTNSLSVTNPGTYSVTVSNEAGCSASTSAIVTIDALPTITISENIKICQGQTGTLSVAGNLGNSYRWSTGSTLNSISVSEAGTYSVTATNEAGCTTTASSTVTVKDLPTVTIRGDMQICTGSITTLTANSNENCIFTWNNGSQNPLINVFETGIYTVTATNQSGCSSDATVIVTEHPLPQPVITGSHEICSGEDLMLTVSQANQYRWSTGDTGRTIMVSPTGNTTYFVTTTNEYGCQGTTSVIVTLKALPLITFNGNFTFCEGGSTTVTASGGNSYIWSTGVNTPAATFNDAGTYTVTATNSLGCRSSKSVDIIMNETPLITISGNEHLCKGDTGTLTAHGGTKYYWSTGEQDTGISIHPTGTTTYTVTGFNAAGCSSTTSKIVEVEELPDVQISGNLTVCQGDIATLIASGGDSYMWNNGDKSDSIHVTVPDIYHVTATSNTGCSASTTATVTVNPLPDVTISGNATLCTNETQTLTAAGGISYLWNTGDTTENITISEGDKYRVTATNSYGCIATTTFDVTELNQPDITIISDNNIICRGDSALLTATTANANHFNWNTGDTSPTLLASPTETTLYSITVTDENGCHNTDNFVITVNPTYNQHFTGKVCQGEAYSHHGFDIPAQDTAGIFMFGDTLKTVNGCDSILHLTLTVDPLPIMPTTINGPSLISSYGPYIYTIDSTVYIDNYEWRVSNTNWELTENGTRGVLNISTSGNGTLTAKGINSCGYAEASIAIRCDVGIDEYADDSNILLYPNPAGRILNINLENTKSSISQLQLFDNLGHHLQTLPVKKSQYKLDCSQYAAGIYFIKFIDDSGNMTSIRKIIIHP